MHRLVLRLDHAVFGVSHPHAVAVDQLGSDRERLVEFRPFDFDEDDQRVLGNRCRADGPAEAERVHGARLVQRSALGE